MVYYVHMATTNRSTKSRTTKTAAASADVTIGKKKGGTVEPVSVNLHGEVYSFTPVKAGLMMSALLSENSSELDLLRGVRRWMLASTDEETVERIIERLGDPNDDLDLEDLQETVQAVSEFAGGRPTT